MYRQIFTPNEQTDNIQLTVPREWYGQIDKPQQKANVKTKLSDKYRGVFSIEDAKSFDEHTRIMRREWSGIVMAQSRQAKRSYR